MKQLTNFLHSQLLAIMTKTGLLLILGIILFGSASFAQTYQVNGNAVNSGGGLVRMTTSSLGAWQTSSAWSTTKHDLNQPFDQTFDMFFGCENGPNGGDGMTFTFQNQGINAIGGGGGFLGIGGGPIISPAISIEFDTYDGTAAGGLNEIPQDHIAIDVNGDVNNTGNVFAGTSGNVTVQPIYGGRDLEDCATNSNNYYTIRVVWNPTARTLQLYEEGVLTMTYTRDLINTVFGGNSSVYWGFTAATGTASNEQWIAPSGTIIPWSCSVNSCCTPFTVTPTGPTMVCSSPISKGTTGTYASYQWSTGQTTSSVNITTPGTYTVDVIQNQGGNMCPGRATFNVTTSGPTATLSGGATICNDGSSTPLSVALTGTSPWTLTYAIDGVNQPPVTGITSTPYIIAGRAPHTYTLASVGDNGGCNGAASGTAIVNAYSGLPIGHDNTFNAPGSTTLNVDNGGGVYEWYTASTGGTLVYTGTAYNTPTLSATTTYYVRNTSVPTFSSKSVALLNQAAGNGPAPNDINNGGLPKADLWLNFTANSSFTLSRVTCAINVVLPWSSSYLSITINDLTDGTSYLKDTLITAALSAGMQTMPVALNYTTVAGHNYRISYEGQTSSKSLGGSIKGVMYWQLVAASSFPINTNSELSITTGTPNTRYAGLFDWRITTGSPAASCGRTPVTAYAVVPAPITLLSFTANYVKPKTVSLQWATAAEINNDYFTIQRSEDGINFTDILIVPGAGNSDHLLNYNNFDLEAISGISYYRLKQTDYDGTFTYSSIVKVSSAGNDFTFLLSPNLVNADTEIKVMMTGAASDQKIAIDIYDVLGRKLYTVTFTSDAAGNVSGGFSLAAGGLTTGTYIAVVGTGSGKEYKQKIVFLN